MWKSWWNGHFHRTCKLQVFQKSQMSCFWMGRVDVAKMSILHRFCHVVGSLPGNQKWCRFILIFLFFWSFSVEFRKGDLTAYALLQIIVSRESQYMCICMSFLNCFSWRANEVIKLEMLGDFMKTVSSNNGHDFQPMLFYWIWILLYLLSLLSKEPI